MHGFAGAGDEVFRFCFVIINRSNDSLYISELRLGECLEIRIALKKLRRHLIHLLVGALRGEHHGDKKLILILKSKLGVRIRIEPR